MKLYVSSASYLVGKLYGLRVAGQLITQSAQETGEPAIPAVLVIRELMRHGEVTLHVDGGATHIAKSRSRQFSAALASNSDVWVSIDDDVSADARAVETLLAAVSETETPRLCMLPCLLREQSVVNVEWSSIFWTRPAGPGKVRNAARGGFGCVAMNRAAMTVIRDRVPSFRDDDGEFKSAAFIEVLEPDGRWLGEDLAFFSRVPARVEVTAVVSGTSTHAGAKLHLDMLESST